MPKTTEPYRLLARYYDDFFTLHRDGYRRSHERLLGAILPRIGSACDLACGTGTTAIEIATRGISVFALDVSPIMCRLTREKAARAGVTLHVLRRDMRNFRLPEPVDLITCEFDALNHLPHKRDLQHVTRSAARALRAGGYFCFDVSNRKAFEQVLGRNLAVRKTRRRVDPVGRLRPPARARLDQCRMVHSKRKILATRPGARGGSVLESPRDP
jgi:SAM-dependent methyltransferase